MSTSSSYAVVLLQHPSVQKNHLWQTAFLNASEFTKDYSEIIWIQ